MVHKQPNKANHARFNSERMSAAIAKGSQVVVNQHQLSLRWQWKKLRPQQKILMVIIGLISLGVTVAVAYHILIANKIQTNRAALSSRFLLYK